MPEWNVQVSDFPSEAALPRRARDELRALLEQLEEDGNLPDAKPLRGYQGWYTCRFFEGRWRLVYEIRKHSRLIRVVSIGPRSEAYRGLKGGKE